MHISIKTPSRLHFGFMDLSGDLGRRYGSVGVALDNPNTVLEVRKSRRLLIHNGNEQKIRDVVRAFSEHYGLTVGAEINVIQRIPEHSGLGSGTQLSLAVFMALAKLYNIQTAPIDILRVTGRGARSGIGIGAFEKGGFILDSGQRRGSGNEPLQPSAVILRHPFPDDWYFVIVIPEKEKLISGAKESAALKKAAPSIKLSEEICRLILMNLLPALYEKDIEVFGRTLTEIDRRNGMFFQNAQGGMYTAKMADAILEGLMEAGAHGAGQSSWGPGIYGLAKKEHSGKVAKHMNELLRKDHISAAVLISSCNTNGARIQVKAMDNFSLNSDSSSFPDLPMD
ncbi:MAG: GHMP kinase [Deltaproteobacteria bacterium]|nr:GHMP kinase [Deltaproteobacteria bacterium]